jgi:hypothetical protein
MDMVTAPPALDLIVAEMCAFAPALGLGHQ